MTEIYQYNLCKKALSNRILFITQKITKQSVAKKLQGTNFYENGTNTINQLDYQLRNTNSMKNWSSNIEYVYNYVILIVEEQRLKQQSHPPTNIPGRLEVIPGMEEQNNAWGPA